VSTIDTSTWNPDPDLNESINGIPLNSSASIAQTWQAIQMLMAAGGLHGLQLVPFTGATASADGKQGLVPKPEAGDQDKVLKGDGTWGTVAAANHVHGNISSDGAIGSTSGLPIITGTNGILQAGAMITEAQIEALFG